MLITVIKTATVPVKTSQMPSIGDERHISDGKNASATTRYRMPKPTSTHFTRIASPRHVRVMSALPPKADQSLLGLPETAPAPRLLRANPRLGWNGFALSPQVGGPRNALGARARRKRATLDSSAFISSQQERWPRRRHSNKKIECRFHYAGALGLVPGPQ
jgi:hypothetical protein